MSIVPMDEKAQVEAADAADFSKAHSLSAVLMRFAETKGYIQYDFWFLWNSRARASTRPITPTFDRRSCVRLTVPPCIRSTVVCSSFCLVVWVVSSRVRMCVRPTFVSTALGEHLDD